jgi:signal transduction histidine kinase
MTRTIRALLIEGTDADERLLAAELSGAGLDPTFSRVTAGGLGPALEGPAWDVIFCLGELDALARVKERGVDVPFIVVSASGGERDAVDAMRMGASDFLAKDQLTRVAAVVERVLREAEVRREAKRLEGQLLLADRMVTVGTLAAGVAHEINNPLAALVANLEFLAADMPKVVADARLRATTPETETLAAWLDQRMHEIAEPLAHAREAADRVRHIVRDLKVFSRRDEEEQGKVDLRRVLESSLRLAWHEIRYRARVVHDYVRVPPVEGNEARLGQVFLNLIINAAQAIEAGKPAENEIRIATRVETADRVMVEVSDTGGGIPPDVLPRIFDPFFTTKPSGVGTGLGLAICHNIVTAMGGTIAVESELGRGTKFRVVLPAAKRRAVVSVPPSAGPPSAARARILVIDDDPLLGNVFRRLLGAEHDIFTVTSAQSALELLTAGRRFDVIFCDVMMPLTPGAAVYRHVSDVDKDQASRMIFMTGGVWTPDARGFLERVPNRRLEKPFDVTTLRALVDEMLR